MSYKIDQFYDTLQQGGINMPTKEEFAKNMADPKYRKTLYEGLQAKRMPSVSRRQMRIMRMPNSKTRLPSMSRAKMCPTYSMLDNKSQYWVKTQRSIGETEWLNARKAKHKPRQR